MTNELKRKLEAICEEYMIDSIDDLREIVEQTLEAVADDTEQNEPYAKKSIEQLRQCRSTINCELDEL